MIYRFVTPTIMPIEAITVLGLHAKPNSTNPIGYFGTGLKLAIAATLRLEGSFRLVIDGVEYVFYTSAKKFRGTTHEQIRMKRRKGLLSNWSYHELPYTTEYGKNLKAWQIFREIESNTRDEAGQSGWLKDIGEVDPARKTIIDLELPGLEDVADDVNSVFLDHVTPVVVETDNIQIHDQPSKYLYYRGVRVYELRYPARFTYNFKKNVVRLTEDRTPENIWWLMYLISTVWMTEENITKEMLYKVLHHAEGQTSSFEKHDLTWPSTVPPSQVFRQVSLALSKRGVASPSIGLLASSYRPVAAVGSTRAKLELEFEESTWRRIAELVHNDGMPNVAAKITSALQDFHDDVPF